MAGLPEGKQKPVTPNKRRQDLNQDVSIAKTQSLSLVNCRLATMAGGRYNTMENAALLLEKGRISWAGPLEKLPGDQIPESTRTID